MRIRPTDGLDAEQTSAVRQRLFNTLKAETLAEDAVTRQQLFEEQRDLTRRRAALDAKRPGVDPLGKKKEEADAVADAATRAYRAAETAWTSESFALDHAIQRNQGELKSVAPEEIDAFVRKDLHRYGLKLRDSVTMIEYAPLVGSRRGVASNMKAIGTALAELRQLRLEAEALKTDESLDDKALTDKLRSLWERRPGIPRVEIPTFALPVGQEPPQVVADLKRKIVRR